MKVHEGKKICISDKDPTTMIETDLKRKYAKDKKETKTPKKGKHQSRKNPSKRKTPEKRQLHDSDSDFKSSRPSKKAKKGVTNQEREKNQCSPESLLSIILGLSKKQKECIRSMGFRSLLKMKITDISLKLGFYILQKLDYERILIDVEGVELKITTQSVHDMLGIPKGGTKLTQLDQWPKDDTSYDEWKQQCLEGSIIRLNAIKKSTSMGRYNLFPLSYISRKTDISNIDWCSYVLNYLVRTKNSYIPYSDNNYFVGPSTFLVLFYVDNIHSKALMVTHKRLTICYWSSEKIRYRETFEQEEDQGDTDLEDEDEDEVEHEDDSVKAYESKLDKMLNSFEKMKEKLNSKLNDVITKFPEKESFWIFKENMTNIIVGEKTKSTTLFEFPSNETIVEGINLTPIMGQKTNDQKDNEDEEGNRKEENDDDGSQPEVDYLLDSNEVENEGIKNDEDKNQKEVIKRLFNKLKMKICLIKLLTTLWIMSLEIDFQKRENQKVYINKEKKLKKQREMIQVQKNKHKLRKEMQKIEERISQKMKTTKEKKLTRQKEMKEILIQALV
uniref:Uncharacterized protein n=1 Tax=Lactuca sativa TaxID=4236 RepID=A0A9R1W595_LACSA|nr:hypothetical protein LSAT_V11C300139820 [Lactuca sativa]